MLGHFGLITVAIALALFFGLMLFLELGRRVGVHEWVKFGKDTRAGVGIVENSVYGLLGLLLGFMFSGAAGRFEHRRVLIAEAVNATGTAWQRVDILPQEQQPPVRDAFRRYVDALLAWYTGPADVASATHEPPRVIRAQNEVWSLSVAACLTTAGERARMLLLPALNDMFGAVERERAARIMHPPVLVFAMLGVAGLASALFAGYGMAVGTRRNWMYIIGIAAAVSIAVYVILELEYPRLGFVRIDEIDRTLQDLRMSLE